jgi:ABC-type uncharacterized transport system permease subunit
MGDIRYKNHNYGFIHFIKYFWVNLIIGIKTMTEFKANFYSSIFKNSIMFFSSIFFLKILANKFGEIIGWSFMDFIIFFYFVILIQGLSEIIGDCKFEKDLKNGKLNIFLQKPGNLFFNYIFYSRGSSIMFLSIHSTYFLCFIFYNLDINFIRFIISILISLILAITFFLFRSFLDSFSFLFFELGQILRNNIYEELYFISRGYPLNFFEKSAFKLFIMFFPLYYVSTLIVPIFQNKQVPDLLFQISIILFLITIFSIGIWINWNYGLKKYEAYG